MIPSAKVLVLAAAMAGLASAQTAEARATPAAGPNDKAGAYYNFAMGRLYSELAGAYGNRGDYINKAIEHYRQALKLDPGAPVVFEELTDIYIQTGRLRDAITEAEELLRQRPDNLEARKMLGRIYTRLIGDQQQGRINETALKSAVEQYQKITQAEPDDAESWLTLGKLYRVTRDSVEAEKAFKKALDADPKSDDALTQLALLYSDLGDTRRAIESLKAATDRAPNERSLAALAGAYEQMRDYKNAAEVLKRALELAPDNPRLKRGLAQNLLNGDNLDAALKLYQELAAEEPKDPQLRLRIAEIYRQKRDFASARKALERAHSLDPQSLEVRYDEVNLLEAEGKVEEAITTLRSILDETSRRSYSASETANRAMLLERLGVLYRNSNQPGKAVETFRQIGALDADNASRVAVQIIDTYRLAKDYAKAQQEAAAAMKKYPNDRMVKMVNASLLADMGKVDEAAAVIRSLLSGERDRETHLALAQIWEKGKRYNEMGAALDAAEKLSASGDDKETVFFMRGAMLEKQKKFDQSEAEFRKVLQINPSNASALNYLGYMLADRNVRLEEALKLIQRALELEPGNGAYLDSLGWVYFRQGKLNEAETLFVQSLEKIGKDPTVHDHLGDTYFKLGKTKDAITQWQLALQDYESGAQADRDAGEVARIAKKLESAKVKLAKETGAKK
jgi:tetratricopeptide (TPR) repeat protein